jgi:hypothetical protein
VTKTRDKILDRLTRIRQEFEELCGASVFELEEPKDLTVFGMTLDEAKAWFENEPDFNRRKVTRSGNRREGNTARSQDRVSSCGRAMLTLAAVAVRRKNG